MVIEWKIIIIMVIDSRRHSIQHRHHLIVINMSEDSMVGLVKEFMNNLYLFLVPVLHVLSVSDVFVFLLSSLSFIWL